MADRLEGRISARAGEVSVVFHLSPSLSIRGLAITGVMAKQLPADKLARIARAFEGVPLDARILGQVAKRAFQETEVAIEGLAPDDLVLAILAA